MSGFFLYIWKNYFNGLEIPKKFWKHLFASSPNASEYYFLKLSILSFVVLISPIVVFTP
jgi:hypothetical protein